MQRQAARPFPYLPWLARQSLRCSWLLPLAQPAPSCAPLLQSTTAACQMAAWASPPAGGQWTLCVMPVARATCWHMGVPRTPSAVSELRAQQLLLQQRQHQRHRCKSIQMPACHSVRPCMQQHSLAHAVSPSALRRVRPRMGRQGQQRCLHAVPTRHTGCCWWPHRPVSVLELPRDHCLVR